MTTWEHKRKSWILCWILCIQFSGVHANPVEAQFAYNVDYKQDRIIAKRSQPSMFIFKYDFLVFAVVIAKAF